MSTDQIVRAAGQLRAAVLDDYQHVCERFADWNPIASDVLVQIFHDHIADENLLVERLQPFGLCTYTTTNPTRRAIFEFDKLVRSIYTLRYLRDPQLERNVPRSQNRIESYHQLRSTIAQVGGKKELTGRTDIEIEISNQCARLIANVIIYYNSAILSHLLMKCEVSGNARAVALITRMSPAAWRHILLNGHYTFQSGGKMIDLDALLAGLDLE